MDALNQIKSSNINGTAKRSNKTYTINKKKMIRSAAILALALVLISKGLKPIGEIKERYDLKQVITQIIKNDEELDKLMTTGYKFCPNLLTDDVGRLKSDLSPVTCDDPDCYPCNHNIDNYKRIMEAVKSTPEYIEATKDFQYLDDEEIKETGSHLG